MRTVEIWVDEKVRKMLDATITELKKQGKGRVSYDDALNHLFKTIEELEKDIGKLKAKKEPLKKLSICCR